MSKVKDKFLVERYSIASEGDIRSEQNFNISNNTASYTNITGFSFDNAIVRSFKALVSVEISATESLYEVFDILGVQKGTSWQINTSSVGDDSEVSFDITSSGQLQYTCSNYAGFVSGKIKFSAITTSK